MRAASILHEAFIADFAECFNPDRLAYPAPFDVIWSHTPASFDFTAYLRGLFRTGPRRPHSPNRTCRSPIV